MAAVSRDAGKSFLRRHGIEYGVYAATACVVAVFAVIAIFTLRARGIHAGFAFLWDTAGFDISFSLIPYDATKTYANAFLVGLLNTLVVSAVAIGLATCLGLGLAIARLSEDRPLRALAIAATELVRNTPLLLQLFVWYFMVFGALPPVRQSLHLGGFAIFNNRGIVVAAPGLNAVVAACLAAGAISVLIAVSTRHLANGLLRRLAARSALAIAGVLLLFAAAAFADWDLPVQRGFNVTGGLALPPEFAALVTALAIYAAAFIGEAFRSGFVSVAAGQWEAAQSLGLGRFATVRLVVLPQAIRAALPALGNQFVNVVKASSLAAAVGFPDLMQVFGKTTLNQTGQAVEVISITMAVYLAISLGISGLVHRSEARYWRV
ncbi:amino acid ABC transporter permease [Bosea sp. NBC_00550]|uniref:amino acid ABC transporter permease n=1 Tax=Bosea sp. NBC_00550 TaxID=2969621 RepID=UPI00222FFFEB|nr:ABC transporter permease subunit [Bosea sp. NBC_00550]UZF94959.1 ABC transporter permease subunit [Bosea sp. NBC_00550]